MEDAVSARPTLRAWLDEYRAIERDYVNAFADQGVSFAAPDAARARSAELRETLRRRGARFMNGGSSVSTGFLSSACAACVGDVGSATFYINLRCPRDCYFCFNPNQADFEEHCEHDTPWRADLEALGRSCDAVSHVGLTGGEPLLCPEETLAFVERARELYPRAHVRLYTSGMFLDDAFCASVAKRGLDEIRFSIKLDEGEESVSDALAAIELASGRGFDVMVEMPVVPGELARMKRLLVQLDGLGVKGINVLEFCYPMRDWAEFERRGFQVKNPPFDVLYDYGYAGGLPIAGSEEACLELVLFALDEGLSLGVHYCSLDNKNRDQVLQANRAVALDRSLYELGPDSFYRIAKVFDGDVPAVKALFGRLGVPCVPDEEGRALCFHPARAAEAAATGAVVALSKNVVEHEGGEAYVRELKLVVWDGGADA